jgi:hypothetical protein
VLTRGKPKDFFLISKEKMGDWVELVYITQAWGLDLPQKPELIRCARNGIILVWRDDQWLDDDFTEFTDHQQRKIRKMCWGSTLGFLTYESLNQVPRLRSGARFRISGTPEQDGLWDVSLYRESNVVARRVLPDYRAYNIEYNVRNVSWPDPDSSSSAPPEMSATQASSTETKKE